MDHLQHAPIISARRKEPGSDERAAEIILETKRKKARELDLNGFGRDFVTRCSPQLSCGYERTSLIVTTNLPFENWTEVLGSDRLTGAMLDRLTHRVHILEANGESYRFKDAKQRLKR